jgi:hypothetical protein
MKHLSYQTKITNEVTIAASKTYTNFYFGQVNVIRIALPFDLCSLIL